MKLLTSAGKYMSIIRRVSPNPHVSSMAPVIHQINTRSWETLVLIKLKLGILTTVVTNPEKDINIPGSNIIMQKVIK